ncbi:hypothetical protein PF005_g434 [Phytophthora fragariae]|uniref:Uncharacterized protein n=1 Tax=Phytophthora fragariae TaxID=53985 RepID=A0A6A3MPG2_9STRA|nr:hypothetical protein PF009_g475 [Phytophthora fragariae]KAE9031170.1 hypothetical protein PF011_g253 [Phytophthora fragariae]KAE9140989.1 hypothetical protein PF007_g439 [Phytophthora fragariae]KAE9155799.1 hypothetical protein PF006_g309 [Phytophthora fragariae]KAE9237955.1 hypothetical protein PF005_g434 [Phytophthora fragariae]
MRVVALQRPVELLNQGANQGLVVAYPDGVRKYYQFA